MDRKSRCEVSPSDSLWFCNLQLLGFQECGSQISLTRTMFDHSNPGGFQQVFYFLFSQLNQEKTKSEFRDCWPILDKKQVSEFRRKVVNLLKEYQKESPLDLPYTNPYLFQSPGGRKFVAFLQFFSSFVMKYYVRKFDSSLLNKPVTKNSKLRKVCFVGLVKSEKQALDAAVKDQVSIKMMEKSSKDSIIEISEKYFGLKNMQNEAMNEQVVEELEIQHPEFMKNGKIDKDRMLEFYDEKCENVTEMQQQLKSLFADQKQNWENIITVMDDTLSKVKLNFNELPKELVAVDNLSMTYENMVTKVLATTERVLDYKPQFLPTQEMSVSSAKLGSQVHLLTELQAELGITSEQMQEHVQGMLDISTKIDWANSELATSLPSTASKTYDSTVLLPPTPSMLDNMRHADDHQDMNMMSHLQLLSPSPSTPHPPIRPTSVLLNGSTLGTTPVSTGQVSRRIPRWVTPDPSPLLRQSLAQSRLSRTNERSEEEQNDRTQELNQINQSQDSTKGSVGVFSPVLCSTKSTTESFSVHSGSYLSSENSQGYSLTHQSSLAQSGLLSSPVARDSTQSKIEMYKKILKSVKGKDQQDESKSNLLSAWKQHRQSLSPLCRQIIPTSTENHSPSPPKPFSPMLSCNTPDISQNEVDSKLAKRLDQLMTSLALSDNSLDYSLGRMSIGGEMELLSPHCP